MNGNVKKRRLDNSGIIHLAARRKWHTNLFRLSYILTEDIEPAKLQAALDRICPRFPMIAAGITGGAFRYTVVPITNAPRVLPEREVLAPMTKREIGTCAFRVLYTDNCVSGEFFHSLTDGHGGSVFMAALLAEYLRIARNVNLPRNAGVVTANSQVKEDEWRDDYFTFAGRAKKSTKFKCAYMLPATLRQDAKTQVATRIYPADILLEAAHRNHVSLTVFLTAVMALSISEIRRRHCISKKKTLPIQIMIPVNLRRLFPCKSLRNSTLFVLPRVGEKESNFSFDELTDVIKTQLVQMISKETMAAAMAANTKLEQSPIVRAVPLPLKRSAVRLAQYFGGERASCISISNLGAVDMPNELSEYITWANFVLTPRLRSLYNCGVITCRGKCAISISRLSVERELETVFFENLSKLTNRN